MKKRKDRASWNPTKLETTPYSQILNIFFNPKERKYIKLEKPEEYMINYKEYPHSNFGLPVEMKIVEIAKNENWDFDKVLEIVRRDYNGKVGLEGHVREILERRQSR